MKKILALLTLITILFTACQKTPEELVVQNKADGELMDAVTGQAEATDDWAGQATAENTGAEDLKENTAEYMVIDHMTFSEKLTNGFKLQADADIHVFDTESMPVISYKRKDFTDAFVENAFSVLLGDRPFYEIPQGFSMSKSQIEERIVQIKYDYDDLESPIALIKGITDLDYLHKLRDETLATLYNALETAPDVLPLVEKDRRLVDGYTYGMTPFNDKKMMEIKISNDEHGAEVGLNDIIGIRYSLIGKDGINTLWTKLQNYRMNGEIEANLLVPENAVTPADHQPEDMTMTPDEAKKIAEDIFNKLGAGDDVRVSGIYYVRIPEDEYVEAVSCYGVELKRYVGNMPIEIEFSTDKGKEKRTDDFSDQFNGGVPTEEMTVFISDEGIIDLEWQEPIKAYEVMNKNVELASTDEVIEVFRQEFKNAYSYYEAPAGEEQEYFLYDISLNYGLARIPNQNGTYMAIPLWDFYAYYYETIREGEPTQNYLDLLTINALDKSRFSRQWGY